MSWGRTPKSGNEESDAIPRPSHPPPEEEGWGELDLYFLTPPSSVGAPPPPFLLQQPDCFARVDPALRTHINWGPVFSQRLMTEVHNFAKQVIAQENYQSSASSFFVSKSAQRITTPSGYTPPYTPGYSPSYYSGSVPGTSPTPATETPHSFLILKKAQDPTGIYVIIKPNFQIGSLLPKSPDQRESKSPLVGSGAKKYVKLYGLEYRFNIESILSQMTPPHFTVKRVVISSRPKTFKGLTSQDKFKAMQTLITENQLEWHFWEQIPFQDTLKNNPRLWAISPYAGDSITYQDVVSWTPEQKFYRMLSYIQSLTEILNQGLWPVDLKIENTCLLGEKLTAIDFINAAGSTYCVYKNHTDDTRFTQLVRNVPITLTHFSCFLTKIYKNNFDESYPKSKFYNDYHLHLMIQLLHEMIFFLWTLWNPNLILEDKGKFGTDPSGRTVQTEPSNYYKYLTFNSPGGSARYLIKIPPDTVIPEFHQILTFITTPVPPGADVTIWVQAVFTKLNILFKNMILHLGMDETAATQANTLRKEVIKEFFIAMFGLPDKPHPLQR